MDRKFKLNKVNVIYGMLIMLIPLICVSGVSVFATRFKLIGLVATGLLSLFYIIFIKGKLVLNTITTPMLLVCGLIGVSASYSIDASASLEFLVVYIVCLFYLFADLPDKVFERTLFVCRIFCITIAITIILSVLIDDFMLKYLSFIINPKHNPEIIATVHKELYKAHSYSGLAMERSDAAVIMNVGIALVFSKYFTGEKLKGGDYAQLLLFFSALIFTNKRTLFIIPILTFCVFMLLGNVKSKGIKFVSIALISIAGFFVLAEFIPQFANIYNRIFATDSNDVLNGREDLWRYSIMMFQKSPLFGYGFGSYNKFGQLNGLLVKGEQWNYYGHNCYLELAGELGFVGIVIFSVAFIVPLIYTFMMIKKGCCNSGQKKLLLFALYIQLMMFIYSFSGNVIYYNQQITMWFFAIAIVNHIRRETGFRVNWKVKSALSEKNK